MPMEEKDPVMVDQVLTVADLFLVLMDLVDTMVDQFSVNLVLEAEVFTLVNQVIVVIDWSWLWEARSWQW